MAEVTSRVVSIEQMGRLSHGIDGTFGFTTLGGAVTPSSGLVLAVGAVVSGTYVINDTTINTTYAGGTATVTAADATNPRVDIVWINSSGVVAVAPGAAAASPVPPTIGTTGDELAMVLVGAGVTVINTADIIDRRQLLPQRRVVYRYKSATQAFTNTTFADVIAAGSNTFSFPIAANEIWAARYVVPMTFSGIGGSKFQLTGPGTGSPVVTIVPMIVGTVATNAAGSEYNQNALMTFNFGATGAVSGFSTVFASGAAAASGSLSVRTYNSTDGSVAIIDAFIVNGSTAGTVVLQQAQNNAAGTTTSAIGSFMRAERVA